MADDKLQFFAELGLKVNQQQAAQEAKKLAKVQADALEKELKKVQSEAQKYLSGAPASLKKSLGASSAYTKGYDKGSLKTDLSKEIKGFLKEQEAWQKIIDKNESELEKEEKRLANIRLKEEKKVENQFKKLYSSREEYEKDSQKFSLEQKKALIEQHGWDVKKKKAQKEQEREEKRKQNESDKRRKEQERLERREASLRKKRLNETISGLKSMALWTAGITAAGFTAFGKMTSDSAERAFSFRNTQDIIGAGQMASLRKWQAASKVYGNISEQESLSAYKNLSEFVASMRDFGQATQTNAGRLLGIDWAEKDTGKLINSISNAILRQGNAATQAIMTKEIFGDERYLSAFKRWRENPQSVWDLEKRIEQGSLTSKQIKDLDLLGQQTRETALLFENLKDQISATFSPKLAENIKAFNKSLNDFVLRWKRENGKGFIENLKENFGYIGKGISYAFKDDASMGKSLFLDFLPDILGYITKSKDSNKEGEKITINVGGVNVNQNENVESVVKDVIKGAIEGTGNPDYNNLYHQMLTMNGG